jgi:hypothetical protein
MASKANIWKLSLFRTMGSMFKGTAREHKCIRVPEEGICQVLSLAMGTGWMSKLDEESSWAAIHKLKVRIVSTGEDVFFISDRSYIPLNPCNILTKEEIDSITSLENVAAAKYDVSFRTCPTRQKMKNAHQILNTLLYLSFAFTAVIFLIVLVKGKI